MRRSRDCQHRSPPNFVLAASVVFRAFTLPAVFYLDAGIRIAPVTGAVEI
jgi:hypothetical protein